MLKQLDDDLVNPKWQKELNELLSAKPSDADKIYRTLKEHPGLAFELHQSDPDWARWANREFFKNATKNGKKFEEEVVLNTLKDRTSPEYGQLKTTASNTYGVNLDEYDMYSQVQLKYNGDEFFVADQVYVKWGTDEDGFDAIVDYVVIENKLRSTTPLTKNQADAKKVNDLTVCSLEPTRQGELISGSPLLTGNTLNSDSAKWIKVHDGETGDKITGMVGI